MEISIELSNPTGNFWIDNGLVVLYDKLGEGDFEISDVLDRILEELVVETGNTREYFDRETGQFKKYRKKNWKYPTNLFIKSTPKVEKTKINNKTVYLRPPQYKLKLEFKKKGVCDICGNTDYVTDAKMWMFPFSVEPSRFSNFYSGLKEGTRLCPRCALSGLATYQGWLWKAQGRDKLHIFLFQSDLKTLFKLRANVFKVLEVQSEIKGGNIPLEFSGNYIHEVNLGLLLTLMKELSSNESILPDEGKRILEEIFGEWDVETPITLFTFSGTPGKAFNMDSMMEFSEFRTLYRLYKSWISILEEYSDNPHRTIVNIFKQFTRREGNSFNTIWREYISWAILELRDPAKYIEDYLYDARAKDENPEALSFGSLDIFNLYWKEVINMDEKLMTVLQNFGHKLGKTAREANDMGILYSLRNAKNPDDFFRVLNDAQFRFELTIPEDILKIGKGEKIMGSPWIRVKTLLSIYAMNSYLWTKSQPQEV